MTKPYFSLSFLLGLFIAGCSSSANQDSSVQDTLATDSIAHEEIPVATTEETTAIETTAADKGALEKHYTEIKQVVTDSADYYYTVNITNYNYESTSDMTWYFTKTFAPRYYKDSWSAEGMEGGTEYIIMNNKIVCATEEEATEFGRTDTKWCAKTGGSRIRRDEFNENPSEEEMPPDYNNRCKEGLKRCLETLHALINEGAVTDEDEDPYQVIWKEAVDVGMEEPDTISSEVVIPKALYKKLKGG